MQKFIFLYEKVLFSLKIYTSYMWQQICPIFEESGISLIYKRSDNKRNLLKWIMYFLWEKWWEKCWTIKISKYKSWLISLTQHFLFLLLLLILLFTHNMWQSIGIKRVSKRWRQSSSTFCTWTLMSNVLSSNRYSSWNVTNRWV